MKNTDKIIPAVILMAVLIIPLPNIAVNAMFAVALVGAVAILITYFIKKTVWQSMPKFVLGESLLVLACSIQATINILITKTIEEQNPILSFVQINYVVAIFMALVLIGVMIFIVMKGAVRVSEIAARYALDSMSRKMFDIDNRLEKNEISKETAELLRKDLREENVYYSTMDGASKFLLGTVKAVSFVYFVSIIGGTLISIKNNGLPFNEALIVYSSPAFFCLLICMIPSLITAFTIGIATRGKNHGELTKNESDEEIRQKILEAIKTVYLQQLEKEKEENHE